MKIALASEAAEQKAPKINGFIKKIKLSNQSVFIYFARFA